MVKAANGTAPSPREASEPAKAANGTIALKVKLQHEQQFVRPQIVAYHPMG